LLKLALSAYLFALGIFIPLSGWFVSLWGLVRVYCLALLCFGLGSAICGCASSLNVLIIGRIIQGFGGAILMPVGRLVLLTSFREDDLLEVTNAVTIPTLLGPVIGPILGGAITQLISWRWVFWVNLPVVLAGVWLARRVIPSKALNLDHGKFSVWQFVFLSQALVALICATEILLTHHISVLWALSLIAFGVFSLGIYILLWKKNPKSFLDLRVFSNAQFSFTVLGSFLSRLALGGIPFLVPLFLHSCMGFSALNAGLLFCVYGLAMLCTKTLVLKIVRKFGFEKSMLLASIGCGLSFAGCGLHASGQLMTSFVIPYVINLAFLGSFVSILFSCLNVYVFLKVPHALKASATAIEATIKQVAMGFGVSFAGALLEKTSHFLHGGMNQFSRESFRWVFLILTGFLVFAGFVFLAQLSYLRKHRRLAKAFGKRSENQINVGLDGEV
jgi:MFS family permease